MYEYEHSNSVTTYMYSTMYLAAFLLFHRQYSDTIIEPI